MAGAKVQRQCEVLSDEKEHIVERVWVSVNRGAELTGRGKEYLRDLALSIWKQPAEERPMKIRYRSNRFEFWLPDLIPYLETSADDSSRTGSEVEPIWVMTYEAAEITGYAYGYMRQLVRKMHQLPEGERPIRLRSRASRNELWLPDLVAYIQNVGYGPYYKPSQKK